MKLFSNIGLALVLTFTFSSIALATDFAVDGKVDVVAALGVAETTELDFGKVTDNDGTITLSLVNTITSDTNGIGVGGTIVSGVYTITGGANETVAVVLTGSSASGLTIGTFTTSEGDLNTVALGAGGSNALTIGADLTVLASAAAAGADQSLSFTIGVTYN